MSGIIHDGPSFRSYNSCQSSSLDIVESNIQVTDNGQITTLTLQRCRKLVLSRYHKLLIFIAWKPFAQRRMISHPHLWRCANILYIFFVTLNLLYATLYEILFCEGHVATCQDDCGPSDPSTTIATTSTTTSYKVFRGPWNSWDYYYEDTSTAKMGLVTERALNCHVVTIYAIPDALHILAFIIGFWYFRIKENESLDALMERVFLQAYYMLGAQEKLIRNARWFMSFGLLWVVLITGLSGLAMIAYNIPDIIFQKYLIEPDWLVQLLGSLQFLGRVYCSCTYIAIIVNYSIQCEFIVWAVKSICLQLNERSANIKDSMHEILKLRDLISQINGSLSKLASLCVANFALKVIIGFSILVTTVEPTDIGWAYRVLYPLIWAPLMIFPLILAARVTKTGEKLRYISCDLRVFGYKNCNVQDLDSFILFVSNAKLRAKLFSMPIKPSYIISAFAVVTFVLLLLFQTNVIQTTL